MLLSGYNSSAFKPARFASSSIKQTRACSCDGDNLSLLVRFKINSLENDAITPTMQC